MCLLIGQDWLGWKPLNLLWIFCIKEVHLHHCLSCALSYYFWETSTFRPCKQGLRTLKSSRLWHSRCISNRENIQWDGCDWNSQSQISSLEVQSVQCGKLLSDECLGFPMYFYKLLLFPHKKIHICFEGYVATGAWLEHNILIQCWKDIDIHCQ